jgi:DNA-binding MarR family transcriptional regulator
VTTEEIAGSLGTTAVGRIVSRLSRHLKFALSTLEITPTQYRLLVQLAQGTEASTALARKLTVSPPSVTTVVDGLVQRGAVERTSSAEDRRRVFLTLTDVGRELLSAADATIMDRFATIAGTLDDPDAALAALTALDLWAEALDRYRAQRVAVESGLATAEVR